MGIKEFRLKKILFALIIFVALFLRLYNLDYMEFKGDEAFNSLKALKLAEEVSVPLTAAVSTTGMNEPPIFIYLLAVPYFFTTNPVIAAGFIALLNVSGIIICYLFIKKFYNERAALIAAAFYAVNPWQMLFSRKIWTQELLAFFVIIFLYFIFNAIYEKKKIHLIYALIALGLLLQIHFSALYFIIVIIAIFTKYWDKFDKRYIAVGSAFFLLTFFPYTIFQIRNDFADANTLIDLTKEETLFHSGAFTIPFKLISTNGFDFLFGQDFSDFEENIVKIAFLDFLLVALLFSAIIFLFIKHKAKGFVLIAWLIAGTIFIAFSKVDSIDTHYFLSFFPLYFIIIGTMLDWVLGNSNKIWKYGIYAIIIILVLYQLAFSLHFLNFVKEKECIPGEYGAPYAYRLKEVKSAINQLDVSALKVDDIHKASCSCAKCDLLATKFIIKHLGYSIKENEKF